MNGTAHIANNTEDTRSDSQQRLELASAWLKDEAGVTHDGVLRGLEVVNVLQSLGLDEECRLAGLLFCCLKAEALETKLGECPVATAPVMAIVEGTARLDKLSTLSRHGESRGESSANEDNLRKMLITMVDDVRVVVIKLADQLVMLRAARHADRQTQVALSEMTLDVYAPLANRLGIWQLKWEMEDFALRFSDPDVYRQLAEQLAEKRVARERYIGTVINALQDATNKSSLDAEIYGRPKHLYSIWKKMRQKGLSFENLWDIRAVRVIVNSLADCYAALGVVHTLWRHLPGEFDDYIATPKANGYRSIHTVVIGPEDKSVEVQIRTREMHEENELGVAAHWRYKEGGRREDNIDDKVLWLRQLLDWKQELSDSDRIADAFHETVENQRVYVFSPKGTVVDLPDGATPIDFAYTIHSEVGHSTRGARVNGKMVPLGYRLRTGDQVQIQTASKGSPSRDWLRSDLAYIKTHRARARIQQWFKQKDHDQHVAEGRAMLERELNRLGILDLSYEKINEHTPYLRTDDLLAALGAGDYKVSRALLPFKRELERRAEPVIQRPKTNSRRSSDSFKVNGVGNLLTSMARCCQPVLGDQIVGFITTGRGVTIHTQRCINIRNLSAEHQNRLIEVEWGGEQQGAYAVELEVSAYHRTGILHDITQVLKEARLNPLKVNMDVDDENVATVMLRIEVSGLNALRRTLGQLSKIQNVFEVKRVTN